MITSKIQNGRQGGPKMGDGVRKGVSLQFFGRSRQRSLNKFFDPHTPSMRKVDNGEKKKNVVASWLTDWNAAHLCQFL